MLAPEPFFGRPQRHATRRADHQRGPGIVPGYLRPDGGELLVNIPADVAAWDLDPDAHLEAACRIAGRQLTPAEWATYLGGFAGYRATCPE